MHMCIDNMTSLVFLIVPYILQVPPTTAICHPVLIPPFPLLVWVIDMVRGGRYYCRTFGAKEGPAISLEFIKYRSNFVIH